jgi:hypothetical protein
VEVRTLHNCRPRNRFRGRPPKRIASYNVRECEETGFDLFGGRSGLHVVVLSRTKDGWDPKDTFDIQVKGGDILPPLGPIGLAAHAARDTRQTLWRCEEAGE